MLNIYSGNLLQAEAEALVNSVNCVGVMGKGIALQFKQAFPANFKEYHQACKQGKVIPGQMFIHATERMLNPKYIINFPTKRHWKGKSRMEDIDAGLAALVTDVKRLGIQSIAVPPLGCGNGGLEWKDVRSRIEAAFSELPNVKVLLYAPKGAPDPEKMPVRTKKPRMTRGRALIISLIEPYRIPDYRLSRLEVQKLAYLLQSSGEDLQLKFVKHSYGPYAENLNHVLQHMEGHFIRGFGDRSTEAKIRLLPGAIENARQFISEQDEIATRRLKRVQTLIEGFETPYGMELLTSVHWVATRENIKAKTDSAIAVKVVHDWNKRKRSIFQPDHIQKAWEHLKKQHWFRTEIV